MKYFCFAIVVLILPGIVLAEYADYQVLQGECFSGNAASCLSGAKIASKEKKFRDAADMAIKGCAHVSKESCEFQIVEEAKDGNLDGFLKALSDACSAGSKKYCSMKYIPKLSLFEKTFKAADPELFELWRTGARAADVKKISKHKTAAMALEDAAAQEAAKQKLIHQCEAGSNASCVNVGKHLLGEKSFLEALEVLERACDRKSGEACELAGIAAGAEGRTDYSRTLIGIGCKLGRISACRLEGELVQLRNDRNRARAAQEEESRAIAAQQMAEAQARQNAVNAFSEAANAFKNMQGPRVDMSCVRRCTEAGSFLEFCNSKCAY